MEKFNYSKFVNAIDRILGRIFCKFGDHSYTWKLQKGEKISLSGNPPDRATCKYCKRTFKELTND